MKVLHKEQLRH